jgi:hypothetical protein
MEAFTTPLLVGVLLALFTGLQTWISKGRYGAIEKRLDRLDAEVSELRTMIMQLAIAVGVNPKPQTS